MYNALLNLDFSSHMKLIAFADDLAIMTRGNTPGEAEVFANLDLAKIEKWATENKMQFNENKSKAMLITRNRKNTIINITLTILQVVKEVKYLGIYFDSRFTFDNHIRHIAKKKSTKLIYMLGKLAKHQWGSRPQST
jgi:hypothetical protein